MSTEIATKREEIQKLQARANAILEQYKDGLPGDKVTELKMIKSERDKRIEEVKAAQDLEEAKADVENIDKWLNEPVRNHPHGINGDDSDRKRLQDAGWEFKSGIAYGPNSLGVPVPMFGEEVLLGDIASDANEETKNFINKTRATFRPEYKSAYVKHMRMVARTQDTAMAWNSLTGEEQKALSEGSDTAGGFLVPPDAQSEMLARVAQMAVFRRRARVQATSSDILKWPAVAPHSTSGSIYSSGFVGGWVGETPAFSETDPAFQTFNIPVKKLRIATKLSNDLVQDSQVNILAFLAQNGAENMALVEDNGFITGDGGPLQPRGILNAGIATVDVEGATSNTLDNSTSNTGSAPKIIDLTYAVPSQYVGRASWLMKRSIEGKIRKLVDGNGNFHWPARTASGFSPAPPDLMGYPVDNSEFMMADGTDANQVLVFGDLSQYIIAQRAAITSRVLNERFADTDQVGIILFERVGGDIWNLDALRIGIV